MFGRNKSRPTKSGEALAQSLTPKIRFVCASRHSSTEFLQRSALGRSLALYKNRGGFELKLYSQNASGLPKVYNSAIRDSTNDPAILVFVHDDVHLCDFFWQNHISEGLTRFDILGLAGNTRRVPGQPSWAFVDTQFTWDEPRYLSGCVGHGAQFPPKNLSFYGPPGREVKILDGLMVISHSITLLDNDLFFDERFDFHFYDLDFCRQAESKGIRMGTWPISVIHESGGNFGSPTWKVGYQNYLAKWGS